MSYKKTVDLNHDQVVAKYNVRTKQIDQVLESRPVDNGMKTFRPDNVFQKTYISAWELLRTQTTDKEYVLANILSLKAKAFTNSLIPLTYHTPIYVVSDILGVDRRSIKERLDKLFELGVIANFEITDPVNKMESTINGFWVFNPYLSFNGNAISARVLELFNDTNYAKLINK